VQVLASLAALAVICTALAFVLFFRLIAEVGPARAMVFTYVNPAVAVALGVVVLGEALTVEIVAAFVLILAGSVLATRPSRPRAPVRRGAPPAGEEPAGKEPTGEEPASQGPASQGPASQGPTSQGPASQGPAGEVPAGEEPTAEAAGEAAPR
jgi:hypothetical protein